MNETIGRQVSAATSALVVPGFELAAIRSRASRRAAVSAAPRRPSWWLAIGIVTLPCLVAAATIFPSLTVRKAIDHQMHAWTGLRLPEGATHSVVFTRLEATSIGNAVKTARFRLLLPQGLPAGWTLSELSTDGTGLSYSAEYRTPVGKSIAFALTRALPHAQYVPWVGRFDGSGDTITKVVKIPSSVWITGDEVVTVDAAVLTPAEAAEVMRAMHAHNAPLYSDQRYKGSSQRAKRG